jgi:hypothetical protein
VRNEKDKTPVFINHEKIHLKQQLELFIVVFYLWYGVEFLFKYIKYKDSYQAYRNICFEREAYLYEVQSDYLKTRKAFSFLKFV